MIDQARKRWWVLLIILALVGVWTVYRALVVDLPSLDNLHLNSPSIRLLDRNGVLLYEVIDEGRHSPVSLTDVPQACIDATIATEDAHFYRNPGVSFSAMLRALWQNIRGRDVVSGASTITQQVARNHLLSPEERSEQDIQRKLREIILAYRLTRHSSKDDILALYLNQTYYGNLAYGMDAAARAYFGKPLPDLSLAECALLAGLPQAPGLYDPLTDPVAAKGRQLTVLSLMQRSGAISAVEAEIAAQQELVYAAERFSIQAPHAVFTALAELEEVLPQDARDGGGLVVTTTIDLNWVEAAERISRDHLEALATRDIPARATGAALVAIDPDTGEVLALMGSPDYFNQEHSGAMNMAVIARQPGSTLKPFTYAALFNPNREVPWTPATMMLDVSTPFVTGQGDSYVPVNYDGREHGPVLVREALGSSFNIPAVIALDELGPSHLLEFLKALGITTLEDPTHYDLALTLGGGEVALLELTAAYGTLANGGRAISPYLIQEVRAADGTLLYEAQQPPAAEQVIDPRVAWLITDILSDNQARAAGFGLNSMLQIGRPAAVKTGTTNDYRDNWTIGYTPELVVGVWVGNSSNAPMLDVTGVSGAGPIWHHYMREILKASPEAPFTRPEGLVRVEVCELSGLLPTPDCPYTRGEWFIAGTEPTEADTLYVRVGDHVYLDLPPQARDWAHQVGLELLTSSLTVENDIVILSPEPQAVFRMDPSLPADIQRLRLAASVPAGVDRVSFYIDNEWVATDSAYPFEAWWTLQPGDHQVYVEVQAAEGLIVASDPVPFSVREPVES